MFVQTPDMVQTVADRRDNTVCISAQTGQGMDDLMNLVQRRIEESMMPVNVLVPLCSGAVGLPPCSFIAVAA